MDDHVGFPFVFVVASAENLDERENDPREEEHIAVCEVEGHRALNVCAHGSELCDVGLKIVLGQS